GVARVLRREPRRRIILSQGQQPGQILGTISGSALTVLDLEPRADRVNSRLTAYVRIDNRFAAALTRMLVASFGFLADRKLGDELCVTTEVAEWAVDPSGGFCEWLARGEAGRASELGDHQTTPSQGEHYEGPSPTLSATNVGKCRSCSRRPPGRPHDRRPRLFDGRAEAQCRRAGEGSESAEAADRRHHHRPRQHVGVDLP